ncbi:hypothetical protein [Flaviaesturariibacter amylovorans]|uniref:PH domain-containing protein n=1 Tax=Flaviaesturariibacter amylovorans TaxID=1084520 RepID=A0ABP8GYY9_9BACT
MSTDTRTSNHHAFLTRADDELVARDPIVQNIFTGGIAFVLLLALLVFTGLPRLKGDGLWHWSILVILLLMLVSSVRQLANRRPRIVVNANGFWTRSTGFVGWQQVEQIGFRTNEQGGFSVQFQARTATKFYEALITGLDVDHMMI